MADLVTFGFKKATDAPIEMRGTYLSPEEFHKAMELPNTVVIDVRNYNETVIGKFNPPIAKLIDPCMRKSTEFPGWVDKNMAQLKGKKILVYCTGGMRSERASAYLTQKGLTDINQLEGGIHRYLEQYPLDGGHWIGKNYTFDRRNSHCAEKSAVISKCVTCRKPWYKYQSGKKCFYCKMEIIICKNCIFNNKGKPIVQEQRVCDLCCSQTRSRR